jgi:hypothetical protein
MQIKSFDADNSIESETLLAEFRMFLQPSNVHDFATGISDFEFCDKLY